MKGFTQGNMKLYGKYAEIDEFEKITLEDLKNLVTYK